MLQEQKAKGRRQRAKGKRQKAEVRKQEASSSPSSLPRGTRHAARFALCLLPFAFCLFLSSSSFAEKFHDTPPGGGGGITLAVQPIADLEEAIVVEATEYKTYLANIDRGAGRVAISGLAPGKYDFVLKFKDRVAEGITLDVPDGYQALSKEDRDGVEHVTWISEDIFNEKQIVRMGGNPGTVKLFVEQIRDLRTFNPDGSILQGMIRRFDLCELRKTGKIWTIKMNRHLFREERKIGGPGTRLTYSYVPEIGSIRVGDEMITAPPLDLAKIRPRPWPYFYRAQHREKDATPKGKR